ncbi:MAG: hypothetical protein DRO14_05690 [Thermoprotei archaeon]|nr:MAG: hypothetical protein DRO14_05690 [Thermoprotei archaeon]
MKELHYRFYKTLRQQGFRAHHCHKIERRAKEIVKAVKKNNGRKPVLRKLTARLDQWDYKLDMKNKTLRVAVLGNEWVELKLVWYSYLDRYFNNSWKLKELLISYREGEVWVHLTFEKEVNLRNPVEHDVDGRAITLSLTANYEPIGISRSLEGTVI